MTITRANVETILVKRVGPLLTKAGMAVTFAGANADLNDPIGWALRQSGYSVADISAVADSDLSGLAVADTDKLLDFAEFRALESILTNLDDVDVQLGPRRENLNQLSQKVQTRLDKLTRKLEALYGYNTPTLEAGVITYEFAEHLDA